MGAYPRDTGSNPVEGNGHFFPSYRQLYLSSFFDTHTGTDAGTHPHTGVPTRMHVHIHMNRGSQTIAEYKKVESNAMYWHKKGRQDPSEEKKKKKN